MEYDDSGLKLQLMRYSGEGKFLAAITHGYDVLDRMMSAVYNDINSEQTKTYGYQYNSDGNLEGVMENGEHPSKVTWGGSLEAMMIERDVHNDINYVYYNE